jgi:hypothetical protein
MYVCACVCMWGGGSAGQFRFLGVWIYVRVFRLQRFQCTYLGLRTIKKLDYLAQAHHLTRNLIIYEGKLIFWDSKV